MEQHSTARPSAAPSGTQRLEQLISSQPVMLFIKGTPETPRCGFSSRVVAILRQLGIPFGSFDILSDSAVRQGLKACYLSSEASLAAAPKLIKLSALSRTIPSGRRTRNCTFGVSSWAAAIL